MEGRVVKYRRVRSYVGWVGGWVDGRIFAVGLGVVVVVEEEEEEEEERGGVGDLTLQLYPWRRRRRVVVAKQVARARKTCRQLRGWVGGCGWVGDLLPCSCIRGGGGGGWWWQSRWPGPERRVGS